METDPICFLDSTTSSCWRCPKGNAASYCLIQVFVFLENQRLNWIWFSGASTENSKENPPKSERTSREMLASRPGTETTVWGNHRNATTDNERGKRRSVISRVQKTPYKERFSEQDVVKTKQVGDADPSKDKQCMSLFAPFRKPRY